MHPGLDVNEIVRLIARELVESELEASALSLACCCKTVQEPVLDVLWEVQDQLPPLLKCLPQDVWSHKNGKFSLRRIPTKLEWADFKKYARRMRGLKVNAYKDHVDQNFFPVLQLRAADEPFLPRLKAFECEGITDAFTPFIPFFLSPRTTLVDIAFAQCLATVAVAAILSRIATLCPNLEYIFIKGLARSPVITNAVSEMLLVCDRNSLRTFCVDSPLTEEARKEVFQLPNLSDLWVVIPAHTMLPPITLPNLTSIDIEYGDDISWLRGLREAAMEKLASVSFRCESERIGNFLEAFETVMLGTSTQNGLSTVSFYTSSSWNPNYHSLLTFSHLEELEIDFSCDGGCSSRVDDDIIAALAQAMPGLKVLKLGGDPCQAPAGATLHGLITLASRCPRLTQLRIHFQVNSLADAATIATTALPGDEPIAQWEDCALTDLEVGEIPLLPQSALSVTLTLLRIFPRILNIWHTNGQWATVAEIVKTFAQAGAFVRRMGASGLQSGG